jgi:hypothetical protein
MSRSNDQKAAAEVVLDLLQGEVDLELLFTDETRFEIEITETAQPEIVFKAAA